jgi:hypothetical protein
MCGIVGIIPRTTMGLNGREIDLFEQMLTLNTLRGKDSTGVFTVFKDRSAMVVKTATQPFLLFDTEQWGKFRGRSIASGRFVVGHNRAATRGTVNNDNAHPFVENHIILVHNGTLGYHGNLTKEKVEVDSHAIAHALAGDTPDVVLPKIHGAYALMWYNTETERLYACRNTERPLSIIETKDAYLIASEAWMAGCTASRFPQNRKLDQIIDVEPGKLYSWDLDGKMEVRTINFPQDRHDPSEISRRYHDWQSQRRAHGGPWVDDDDFDNAPSFQQGDEDKTPPEIQNLRQALTDRAQSRLSQESSNDCALTRPREQDSTSPLGGKGLMPTTQSDSESRTNAAMNQEIERLEVQQRAIITENKEFVKGSSLFVKIAEVKTMPNGRIKWYGKVREPNKEMIDAQGFLPDNLSPTAWPLWIEQLCTATVCWHTQTTNGGPCLFMRDIERCRYTDIHGADIPERLWTHVVNNCDCSECGAHLEHFEKLYTHVKLRGQVGMKGHSHPVNLLAVKCPDCVLKVLPEGEIYDKFEKGYTTIRNAVFNARKARAEKLRAQKASDASGNPAVQGGESVSPSTVGGSESTAIIPSTPTLH